MPSSEDSGLKMVYTDSDAPAKPSTLPPELEGFSEERQRIAGEIAMSLPPAATSTLRKLSTEDRKLFSQIMEDLQNEHMAFLASQSEEEALKHKQNTAHILNRVLSLQGIDRLAMYNTTVAVLGAIVGMAAKVAVASFIEMATDGEYSNTMSKFGRG